MSSTPVFPKDTNPNAIRRWQQVSTMNMDQAKASLLAAKADLDALTLRVWWRNLLTRNAVAVDDPIINVRHVPLTMSVNEAVAEYDKTFDRLHIDHAISQARRKAGWSAPPKYKAILLALFIRMDKKSPRSLPEIPREITAIIPAVVAERINRMALYTAMNVSQFENVPPPKLKTQFQNAVWAADQDESRKEGLGKQMSYAKIIGRCNKAKLDAICEVVDSGRGAVCTSFAGATASILLLGRRTTPYRVEMISGPNHCFCLVNRARVENEVLDSSGATIMPGKDFWGPDVILIDAWAGALGHAVFYRSPKDFPKVLQVYLTSKLLQHYDSDKGDT